jgi:demethylmenaquinone methyltransferase/2-methoxy-6-polyprenyl-1,4-benzoquinol methylase
VSGYKHDRVVPYQDSKVTKKEQVEQMFDHIAPTYDKINRILSLRIDVLWRKQVVRSLGDRKGQMILDIATGTADLAMMLTRIHPEKVIGIDISQAMLSVGQTKIDRAQLTSQIELRKEDSESLSFANEYFDAATVAFGVRNFENLNKGLAEIHRTLKQNGQFVILEFSKVKSFPMKQIYEFYFKFITPSIGKIFSKDNTAYKYLPNSVEAFPEGEEMIRILQDIGFTKCSYRKLSFGIASMYIAFK